jgi:lipoprotein-anchoring transpeptidase ErfK/SrfK
MKECRRSLFFCIVALAVALIVVAMPSARGATATEVLVDKSFHITVLRTAAGTLAFPDATGTTGESATPVGTYKVTEKQTNPNWHWEGKVYAPYLQDKDNGLGVRWIGISLPTYGMHGTNDPFSIGKDISHGCVRHQNADVMKAFPMIPTGTPVRIIETPVPQRTEGMVTDFLELYDLLAVMRGSH